MKFKKHISILVAFLLLVSNTGLAFNVHYCGDKVASVETVYFHSDEIPSQKGCCEEKIEKEKSCCRSITVQFQDKSENNLTKSFSYKTDVLSIKEKSRSNTATSWVESSKPCVATYFYEANSPPFFKLYHQYVFYE